MQKQGNIKQPKVPSILFLSPLGFTTWLTEAMPGINSNRHRWTLTCQLQAWRAPVMI